MTIAGKINALVLVVTGVLALFATGITAVREYKSERDLVVEKTADLVANLDDLQVDIYFADIAALEDSLDRFLEPAAVSYVVLYDTDGELLLQKQRSAAAAASVTPPFESLRRHVSPTESGLLVLDDRGRTVGQGLFTAAIDSTSLIQLTLPVFSRCVAVP